MKKVIIMGASSGIGYAVAEALASRGIKVGLGARNVSAFMELKAKYPDTVEYISVDITNPEAVTGLNNLIKKMDGMDIYLHVAGIGYDNPSLRPEREVEMAETNCVGFVRMISAAYRYFRDSHQKGQIAAITSVAGTKGIGVMSAYSSSKKFDQWYLDALEQLSNIEKVDISFTDIRPGWIRTPLLSDGRSYPLEMTLDYALPLILKAIVRKKRVAVIDWRWNLIVGAWRFIPNAIWTRIPFRN